MSIGSIIRKIKKWRPVTKRQPVHHILDQQIVFRLSKGRLPGWRQWRYLPRFLSHKEKIIIIACLVTLLASLTIITNHYYRHHRQVIPKKGGYYVEGLIGTPRYINPLYSSMNQTDRDLSRLIYSSLLTRDQQGKLVNDLAENYEISPDGLIYTIKLRDNVQWSNGSRLTADDVVFTYQAIMDSNYNSPIKNSLGGLDVTRVDDLTIRFTLSQPYIAFLDLLTIGILPAEIWSQIPAESASLADLNLKPIGSGPYQFKSLTKDQLGTIKTYTLTINDKYFKDQPYIKELTFKFYNNYEELVAALNDGSINGANYLPQTAAKKLLAANRYNLRYLGTPQLVAIFINQDDQALKNKALRQALALAIDKNQILLENDTLVSHLANGPILKQSQYYDANLTRPNFDVNKANQLLTDDGWQIKTITADEVAAAEKGLADNQGDQDQQKTITDLGVGQWRQKNNQYLTINLTTINEPDYLLIANQLALTWQKIGIKISLNIVDTDNINSQIIRQKNYSLLLYGQNLGSENDLTALWHSGQSGANGFNLSNYRNEKVDKSLETMRSSLELAARQQAAKELQNQIVNDLPAIFLYNASHLYIQHKKINGFDTDFLVEPADRFNEINHWYIKTSYRWKNKN
ncbi:MAG TPA: peptide ABC transporter substrate-binding protein [bacterium]|jgi:peptide/nickel transport system substrate-binding protein|nr:peptide ABC transporter substrate-binding protein [bacterium]HOQ91370.1 peptide ABC transporter substrate-binding protein [bacterium]HPL22207.1 peptide ABC transporter substrate-binding protein [bacterium]